jgi:hypothetical protein
MRPGAATSRCSLLPCPPRSRPRRALRTPAWPAWSLSGHGRPPRPPPRPGGPGPPPTPDQRDLGSVARVPASATVDRAVDGPVAAGAFTRSGGHGRPTTSTWSQRHRLSMGGDDASGRTGRTPDGWTPDGWTADGLDSGRLDAGRVDSRRPTAGPAGRRPQVTGHRTAGQPDPGRPNPDGGHRLLDSGDRRRGVPAGRVDHGDDA